MSKIKLPLRRYSLILSLLTCYLSIFATSNNYIGTYSLDQIEQRLANLDAEVDLKLTREVKQYLKDYIVSYRHTSEKLIGRSHLYFPEIDDKILEKQLPSEIKFLAVVESALIPSARSKVGAVGMWQFMKPTARQYGLQIDRNIDERRDVEKSTEAALQYLADLNKRFGDWTLALAAYNCGPGNVSKAMRRSGGHDYWSIRQFLPRETRNYVPKFIAITYLMNFYSDHDLQPEIPEELFVKTRKAIVYEAISLADISKNSGLSIDEIKQFNPSMLSGYIPQRTEGTILTLPSESMYTFLEASDRSDLLVPDPLQDLENEVQVVSPSFEKREFIDIQPLVGKLHELKHFEVTYDEVRKEWTPDNNLKIANTPLKQAKRREKTISFYDYNKQRQEKRKAFSKRLKATFTSSD